jgi:hypothetical protein
VVLRFDEVEQHSVGVGEVLAGTALRPPSTDPEVGRRISWVRAQLRATAGRWCRPRPGSGPRLSSVVVRDRLRLMAAEWAAMCVRSR